MVHRKLETIFDQNSQQVVKSKTVVEREEHRTVPLEEDKLASLLDKGQKMASGKLEESCIVVAVCTLGVIDTDLADSTAVAVLRIQHCNCSVLFHTLGTAAGALH